MSKSSEGKPYRMVLIYKGTHIVMVKVDDNSYHAQKTPTTPDKNKERQGHEIGIVQNGRVNVQNGDTQESGHK